MSGYQRIGIDLILKFSSVGALTEDWVFGEFLTSCTATAGYAGLPSDNTVDDKTKQPLLKNHGNIRFVWPTVDFVVMIPNTLLTLTEELHRLVLFACCSTPRWLQGRGFIVLSRKKPETFFY